MRNSTTAMRDRQYLYTKICLYSAFPFIVLFCLFWGVLGSMIPPINAAEPTADLARHFTENSVRLKIAFSMGMVWSTLLMTWSVGIFIVMRRVEGGFGVMSYLQLMGGGLTTLFPLFACLFWLTAAFRPTEIPEMTEMLYAAGWFSMDLGFGVTTVQYTAMAVVFLSDSRTNKLVPKWVNWLGLWCGFEFFVLPLIPHFLSGPFSWSGLFPYWLAFFGPFSFMVIVTLYLGKAVNRLKQEDADAMNTVAGKAELGATNAA